MLLDKGYIGRLEVANKFVRSATFEGMADDQGQPTQQFLDCLGDLADGGVGVIITGMMSASTIEPYQHKQIRADRDRFIPSLTRIAEYVHKKNGCIIGQLVIMGSQVSKPEGVSERRKIISPSGIEELKTKEVSAAMTIEEIKQSVQDYADAARRVKEAGFDGVQVHGAHGYLASKFLTPYYNRRTDEYGGSLENRARFLLESMRAIREAVGPDYPVWVKLNSADFMEEECFTFEECKIVAKWLEEAGVDVIEMSGGNISSIPRQGVIRPIRRTKEPQYFFAYAKEIADELSIPVGVVGGCRSIDTLEESVAGTKIAFVSLSRPLIKEPDLIRRWKEGDRSDATCISCSRCFNPEGIFCVLNKKKD